MIIDTHCHLDMKEFETDRDEVVKRATENGVSLMINPGVDLESSQKAIILSQRYESVFTAVGVQPEEVDQYFGGEEPVDIRHPLERLSHHPKVVAIGECGLDYKYAKTKFQSQGTDLVEREKERQKDIFRRQLGAAVLLDLPLIIHNREADEDILKELSQYVPTKRLRGIFHCFTGTTELAQKVFELGFLVSFTGIITYPNSSTLRETIKGLPLEKIMVETDAPFLAPQSRRGQRNEPTFVKEVVQMIAQIKGTDVAQIENQTSQNAQELFHLSNKT